MNSTRVGCSQGAPPLLGVSRIELSNPTESLQEVNADVVPSTSCSTLADPLPESSHPLQLSSQLISHRCDMCGKICQRKEGLTLHRKTCKGQGVETNNLSVHLTCVLCDTQVGNSSALKKHTGSKKCQQRQVNGKKSISLALALSESERETIDSEDRDSENCNDENAENTEMGKSDGNYEDNALVCEQCGKNDFKSKTGVFNHI